MVKTYFSTSEPEGVSDISWQILNYPNAYILKT